MISPTQPVLAARKRRRVHGTPPGANDEKVRFLCLIACTVFDVLFQTLSPSPPPQRPSSLPHHRVTQPSTMRPNRPRTSGSAKKRDSRVIDDDDKVFQVKIEDESRRRPHSVDVDSDDGEYLPITIAFAEADPDACRPARDVVISPCSPQVVRIMYRMQAIHRRYLFG